MVKPNIIFILIDDLGWKDIGCYGSSFYETPNLDTLARRGARFTDAYAACPVCSPTRASLLTGKYPARVGVTQYIGGYNKGKLIDAPYVDHLPLEEFSLPKALKEGGYATWHVGKWHLAKSCDIPMEECRPYWPDKHGFDVNIGGCQWGHPHGGYFSPYKNPALEDGANGEYLTDRLTDEAIVLINNHKNNEATQDQPFYLNLWYYTVHTPIQAKPELLKKYETKAKSLGLDKIDPFEEGDFFPCEAKKTQHIQRRLIQSNPGYAAMVQSLDDNIGRLLEQLTKLGIADDTIIIFTSDNGGLSTAETSPTSNVPLSEGKGWMYDGGIREPMIVYWPGVTHADSLCCVPVSSPDFYPTILEMAGLPLRPEQHADGESFVPLLYDPSGRLERDAIYWHYPHYSNQGDTPACAVRSGDWKLILWFEGNKTRLYNIREDVGELNDLSSAEPKITKKLHCMLNAWLKDVDAKIPEKNPEFIPWAKRHWED